MSEKIKIVLLSLLGALLIGVGALFLTSRDNPYPLFIDQRGNVVDPYLQREVKNTVRANAGKIQACYNLLVEKASHNVAATTEGRLHLDWLVNAKGKAKNVRIISSQLADTDFQACVVHTIATLRFPAPGQPRYAEHTFTFARQPQEEDK